MIEIKVNSPEQLLNSLDPSPFRVRDLDEKAADYIIGSAKELNANGDMRLFIELPPEQAERDLTQELPEAIRNSFSDRSRVARRNLRELFRTGRISLAIGLIVLATCIFVVQVIEQFGGETTIGRTLEQGLFIVGWVAIWRPLEIFLYDWWPIKRQIDLLDRLSRIQVTLGGRKAL